MTTIINLMGAPGSGKSTLAAGLFAEMKRHYMSVELVTEYAKDLVYDGLHSHNLDQLSIFAEQHRRIARLDGKVDWVVTDSPLFLSGYYASKSNLHPAFEVFVRTMAHRYNNLNFLVVRTHKYDPNGRFHDETASDAIHRELQDFMKIHDIKYTEIPAGDSQPLKLFNDLFGSKSS